MESTVYQPNYQLQQFSPHNITTTSLKQNGRVANAKNKQAIDNHSADYHHSKLYSRRKLCRISFAPQIIQNIICIANYPEFYSRRKLSNRACRSASASDRVLPPPPPWLLEWLLPLPPGMATGVLPLSDIMELAGSGILAS